ncbi:MAG: hypothetical protein RL199_1162 [Pseudomonadota bacterium]|jgi:hypothetical protein
MAIVETQTPTMTIGDGEVASRTVQPFPDRAGGTVLRTAGAAWVTVTGSGLKAIDVEGDAALRELDLSGLPPDIHLTVCGAPSLARINLPADGSGAVVHLDPGGPIDELRVTGRCDLLDVAWRTSGGMARGTYVEAPKGQPFAGAWLGSGSKRPMPAGLVVVAGGRLPADILAGCALTATHISLESCTAPAGLDLPAPLRQAHLRDVETPMLNVPDVGHLRLDGCHGLSRIDGRVERLVLRGGDCGERLDIDAWTDAVDLSGLKAAVLGVAGVARLEAIDSSRIGRLDKARQRPGFEVVVAGGGAPHGLAGDGPGTGKVRPLTAADIERQFASQDAFGQVAMLRWAGDCDQPSQLWLALHVLAVAVDHGHDAAACWRARGDLLARHQRRDRSLRGVAGGSWNWAFPDDLALRGWTGDLRLWLRALAAGVTDAVPWARHIAASTAPAQVCTLLTVAASPDVSPDERALLKELAADALAHAAAPPSEPQRKQRRRVEVAGAGDLGWLHQGVRALVSLAREPDAGDLSEVFARWTERLAPTPEGVRLLDQLASHGCAQARRSLVSLRGSLDSRRDLGGDQKRLLAAALTMVLLAPTPDTEPTFPRPRTRAPSAPSARAPGPSRADPAVRGLGESKVRPPPPVPDGVPPNELLCFLPAYAAHPGDER